MSYRKHVIKCLEVECSTNHNTQAKKELQSYQVKGVGLFMLSSVGVAYLENQNDIYSRAVACGGGGGKGGNCPPWDFQFLWFFKLIIPKSNTEIATWYLLRRHCPPAYLGQATALYSLSIILYPRLSYM